MMTVADFKRIKSEVERKTLELERKKGELNTLMQRLKEEFGCDTLEEAKEKFEKLCDKKTALEQRLETKTAELEELWEEMKNAE